MTPRYAPTAGQIAEENAETAMAAKRLLLAAGFFRWGHDAWCHDLPGVGCVTTAEALDLLVSDDDMVRTMLDR